MRPPAFGYLRFTSDGSPQSAQHGRDELAAYAEREGYSLGEVFIEQEAPGSSAFAALIDALLRSRTRIVVVPSMCHFAHLPGLRAAMRDHIERETGARVVVVAEAANDGLLKQPTSDEGIASHRPHDPGHCALEQ